VAVPAARVTKCAFGGPHRDDLYVTTAQPDEPTPEQSHAGGLFHVRPGVSGVAATPFAG
jgi:xylono-1,5-lactonase